MSHLHPLFHAQELQLLRLIVSVVSSGSLSGKVNHFFLLFLSAQGPSTLSVFLSMDGNNTVDEIIKLRNKTKEFAEQLRTGAIRH
jgi:hypothetical protein